MATSTDDVAMTSLPQKKFYRQRAHCNPMSDHELDYPISPDQMDWSKYFDAFFPDNLGEIDARTSEQQPMVEFLDCGCGYGGLLITLSEMFPETLMLGMEIRVKVADFVQDRILALRQKHASEPGRKFQNVACIRTNAMKYLPNYFHKHQLTKMFFLYPDPHFKKAKHKWRIINSNLLAEYAYVLRPQGLIYTITDVKDLHQWIVKHFVEHALFERLSDDEVKSDVVAEKVYDSTEEGQKVTRNRGEKYLAIYRRI